MPLKFENSTPLTKNNFTNRTNYEAFLYGEAIDIGGGTITREEIDILKEHPELTRISVAGLHQDTFEYFIENYGKQFYGIYFFKNKMVSDLSALETLKNVEAIGYFLNQRAENLWDMSKNKSLEMLEISDFSRLYNLNGIEKAPKLKCLEFGNKVWATSKIDIVPDMKESAIEHIYFNAELSNRDICRFLEIPLLKTLNFRVNLCKTEFLAWISANYPEVDGYCLKPYTLFNDNSGFICGKRKPHIDMTNEKDRIKIEKSVEKFNKLKQQFKGMTFEQFSAIVEQ